MGNNTDKIIAKSEENSNVYVVKTIIVGCLVLIMTCLMNEAGIYHVAKSLMRLTTMAVCVIGAFVYLFTHTFHHISMPVSKYIVLGATVLITLCETTVLSFFAAPLLVYPMLVATHYHSKRVNAFAIGGSLICAALSPLIGFSLHTWDLKYFIWIVHTINPNVIPIENINIAMDGTVLAGEEGIISFISLPNTMYVSMMGILSFSVNVSRRHRQEREIKTIKDMQDKMLYSMADIIENRDFSTGGHVKRTSALVRIMADYLEKNPIEVMGRIPEPEFYSSMVKGAPLHDLGKITVSDTILCKPSALTDEEFDKIKSHPEQSVKIINQVLGSIEDAYLLEITKNIALYHHEKFNGKGYPDGLSGNAIPLEARVMAIADVYDALVSERCYKKPVSHEVAFRIIEESMGTHFDPALKECFEDSFPRFVEYYNN